MSIAPALATMHGTEKFRGNDTVGHIVVVDDDPAVRRSIERLLQSMGFATVSYAASDEFLRAAPHLTEGCVLLDVKMPGVGGLEAQARASGGRSGRWRCRLLHRAN